jgi:hypothetical protein
VIDHEDPARRLAVHAAERSDIDAAGTAMHRVRPPGCARHRYTYHPNAIAV